MSGRIERPVTRTRDGIKAGEVFSTTRNKKRAGYIVSGKCKFMKDVSRVPRRFA